MLNAFGYKHLPSSLPIYRPKLQVINFQWLQGPIDHQHSVPMLKKCEKNPKRKGWLTFYQKGTFSQSHKQKGFKQLLVLENC